MLTDIELDAIEARVVLSNVVGFDDDTAEAHDEQTPPQKTTTTANVTTTVKGGELMTIQQNTSSIGEDEEMGTCEKTTYCTNA